jgi:hypothetical protein
VQVRTQAERPGPTTSEASTTQHRDRAAIAR